MSWYKSVDRTNSPDGTLNSEGVEQNIKSLIDSFFGQTVAFQITYIKPTMLVLDARVKVYDVDEANQTLCLRESLMASQFAKTRVAVAGGKDPENQNYIPGIS